MASKTKRQKSSEAYRILYGTCPDPECQAKLYFPSYDKSVECTSCGQRHEKTGLKNIAEVTNPELALHNLLMNILQGKVKPKKGADNVKVLGLSNYVCKLISPILTYYGMDRESGKAKLLSEMGKGEMFDVSILGDRAFLIDSEHMDVIGYGQDRSGSVLYLAETLKDISAFNDHKTQLVPIHADGDGHCLVHAISRALVGRELFWHALRTNLKQHMTDNISKYKELFRDFVDKDEWDLIIEECDPYYLPPEGEALGLRNIHIFGLANVLHRPIILLDSLSGMNSSGDYSGVFLPGMLDPEKCRGKDGSLNKPLCIAWSSLGRNHYIPLVGIKGQDVPRLPSYMVQKAWGMPSEYVKKYIEFDNLYTCKVAGDKCLKDRYLRQLVNTMEEVYKEKYEVNPGLVADVHQYIYKASGMVGVHPDEVLERTKNAVTERLLYRCLLCEALVEYHLPREQFKNGGTLYKLAVNIHKKLDPNKLYSFPANGAVCTYNETQDCLVPDMERSNPVTCAFCSGSSLRLVCADGSIKYKDKDRTTTPCSGTRCPCGFKHYFQGKEYDNLPEMIPISLVWGGKTISEEIPWFQYESDPTFNSNVFEVAQKVVQKHFPGEFGSERLVQRVVDTILNQTARAAKEKEREEQDQPSALENPWAADTASKIILTGPKKKTLHKEELVKSEKEKQIRKNIQTHAGKVQAKKTAEVMHQATAASSKVKSTAAAKSSEEMEASGQDTGPSTSQLDTSGQSATQSSVKKIKLATSDGQQAMLTLTTEVTYTELQKLITEAVNVPAERQKIRLGFPPKLLEPPSKEGEDEPIVSLSHGDKIMLQVLPDMSHMSQSFPSDKVQPHPCSSTSSHHGRSVNSWSTFEEDAQNKTADALLQVLKNTSHSGDKLDTAIASLQIMSEVSGKDMWTFVQSMPHLFSVGGLFYNQVKRDLGLTDGKHCQLPCLSGKVFRYNSMGDRLELCLEPYGHFTVEPNIELKVKEMGLQETEKGDKEEVKFGSSGAIHHDQDRKLAFSGHGHSMVNTEDRMPQDLACSHRPFRPQVRGFRDLCSPPGTNQGSIEEEPENMMVEGQGSREQYQRLGPGYSVLDQSASNNDNNNIEMFRALAESIEKTLTEDMEEDVAATDRRSGSPEEDVSLETNVSAMIPGSNTCVSETMQTDTEVSAGACVSVTSVGMVVTTGTVAMDEEISQSVKSKELQEGVNVKKTEEAEVTEGEEAESTCGVVMETAGENQDQGTVDACESVATVTVEGQKDDVAVTSSEKMEEELGSG